MARNHLEEQLSAIKHHKSMLKWKLQMTDDKLEIDELKDKIKQLTHEETEILEIMRVFKKVEE